MGDAVHAFGSFTPAGDVLTLLDYENASTGQIVLSSGGLAASAILGPMRAGAAGAGRAAVPSSRALGRALEGAGHVRAAGSAAHHIVAGGAGKAAEARGVLERFGIGINEASNGVFLPSGVHAPIHTNAYYEAVNNALRQATTRQEAVQALDAIRQSILGGGLP
jgi:hypothetical protein